MSESPKPSPSAAVTVNYASESEFKFCQCVDSEALPRKTVGCSVVTVFADNKGNTIYVKQGRNYSGKMRHSRHWLFWRSLPVRGGAWSGGPGVGARCGNGLFPLINLPNFILASLS